MSEDGKNKQQQLKRQNHPDRLTAEPATLELLRKWQEQVSNHFNGNVTATRNDIMNVLSQEHPDALSSYELQALWDRCFDPIKFARSMTKRLEAAKESGQQISLSELIKSPQPPKQRTERRIPKKTKPSTGDEPSMP